MTLLGVATPLAVLALIAASVVWRLQRRA